MSKAVEKGDRIRSLEDGALGTVTESRANGWVNI
jgi:hypothetical protein